MDLATLATFFSVHLNLLDHDVPTFSRLTIVFSHAFASCFMPLCVPDIWRFSTIMFFPNSARSNHSSGNMGLEGLVDFERKLGLTGCSIAWGAGSLR